MLKKLNIILFFLIVKATAFAQQNNVEYAEILTNKGQYNQAIIIYKNLIKTDTDITWYYSSYLNCLLQTKNYVDAEKLVSNTIKSNQNQNSYFIDLGYIYQQKGETAKANKIYNKVLNDLPANQNIINQTAAYFYNLKNYDYAEKSYTAGRKLLKNNNLYTLEIIEILKVTNNIPNLVSEVLALISDNSNYLDFAKNTMSQLSNKTSDYLQFKQALLKAIQKTPDNFNYAELLSWIYLQQNNFKAALSQTIALDKRNAKNGAEVFALGNIFTQNKDYETANLAFNYILEQGEKNPYYVNALIETLNNKKILLIDGKFLKSDLLLLEQDYTLLINKYGYNYQTFFAITELANLQTYYLNKPNQAQQLLTNAIPQNQIGQKNIAELKLQLANICLINNNIWDAALLYSQVEKLFTNQPLGQEAKLRNAKLSFYTGNFKWAKSQLDVLKGSTSQLIANDALDLSLLIQNNLSADSTGKSLKVYASASLLLLKNELSKALLTLDSITLLYPKSQLENDVLLSKAKIFLLQKKPELAALQYQIILNQPQNIYTDDALYLLAKLQQQTLNLPNQAQQNFQKLIADFPASPYLTDARERYRTLRGDAL